MGVEGSLPLDAPGTLLLVGVGKNVDHGYTYLPSPLVWLTVFKYDSHRSEIPQLAPPIPAVRPPPPPSIPPPRASLTAPHFSSPPTLLRNLNRDELVRRDPNLSGWFLPPFEVPLGVPLLLELLSLHCISEEMFPQPSLVDILCPIQWLVLRFEEVLSQGGCALGPPVTLYMTL